ncbi:TPA: hypothetical protein N0F65_012281 [Lagenidium giganteum]|uniref:EGF-like domain-containing protein n=1 Tax=Lagenidium giganteum TaxID=4803 RepID=A0AAV2ZJ83_9STRA|nr:TPA: hypothetical protein N0F65_012281 [Lagenidium giganteum]
MKARQWLGAIAVAAVVVCTTTTSSVAAAAAKPSAKDRPGNCKDDKDCEKGYACVSLQTTRSGTETVKQCLPRDQDADVCAGQLAGMCPTFSSWKSPYNAISSVCTYKPAKNCAGGSSTTSGSGSARKGELMCVPGATDTDGGALNVIYGCIDFDTKNGKLLFSAQEDGTKLAKKLDIANTLLKSCLNNATNSSSSLLCSGQGTCVPTAVAKLEYKCRCNTGYTGSFCDVVESNKCALPGQCETGMCNLAKKQCECEEGTTGPQCSQCDATSEKACSSNGKCVDKKCECSDGWQGAQCKVKASKTVSKGSDTDVGSPDKSDSRGGQSAAPRTHPWTMLGLTSTMLMVTFL